MKKWRVVYRFVFTHGVGKWRSRLFNTEQEANTFARDAEIIAGNAVEARVQPAGFRIPRNIGITINGEIMKRNPIGKHRTTIGANTDGMTCVRYHATDVVCFDASRIVLRSGGWLTATTKKRMNQAAQEFNLGFTVTQKNRNWTVHLADGRTLPFTDGMTIHRMKTNPARRGMKKHLLSDIRHSARSIAEDARALAKNPRKKISRRRVRVAIKRTRPIRVKSKYGEFIGGNRMERQVRVARRKPRRNPARVQYVMALSREWAGGKTWYVHKDGKRLTTVGTDARRYASEKEAMNWANERTKLLASMNFKRAFTMPVRRG